MMHEMTQFVGQNGGGVRQQVLQILSVIIKKQFIQLQKMNKYSSSEGFADDLQYRIPQQLISKGQEAKVENEDNMSFMVQLPERTHYYSQKRTSNSGCSRRESAKNSTAKYREKKKKELTDLEQSVKKLENELVDTDNQIQIVKQKILAGLETLAKMNQRTSNQNIEIFNQLESLLGKSDATDKEKQQYLESFADYDKINLLLDTLKYRIGASGKERQSKLAYQYKSIVNTIFPALYRYILFSSMFNFGIFNEQNLRFPSWEWTKQMVDKLQIQPAQAESIKGYKQRLMNVYEATQKGLEKLNEIRDKLRQEVITVEGMEDQLRQILNPIQSAHWTLFAEKFKYRRELMLQLGFFQSSSIFKREDEQGIQMKGRKRVKLTIE